MLFALPNINCNQLQVHLKMFHPRNTIKCQKNLLLKVGPCRLNTRQRVNHTRIVGGKLLYDQILSNFKKKKPLKKVIFPKPVGSTARYGVPKGTILSSHLYVSLHYIFIAIKTFKYHCFIYLYLKKMYGPLHCVFMSISNLIYSIYFL